MEDRIAPIEEMMTRAQRQLVRETLDQLRHEVEPVTLLLYGKLFELDPSTRPFFHNDLMAQGHKLIATLDAIAASLDRFESIRPRLLELGRLHASYGIQPGHYETLVTALLWAFGQALGPDFDARAREAWRVALAAVTAVMGEGAAGSDARMPAG
jgi:hemoglobin-like flavoprotein